MRQLKRYIPQLLLFALALLALFQVTFNLQPVKWDAIDCFYPWRFHIGECLQNGQMPWWNPYQDLGYPIHADPSSGAWYPMVWLIGATTGYSVYAIGFEFWIHVFLGGIGMLTLARTLKLDTNFALIAAIAFMLSGFFIGNSQHLSYVISACWLPFVLNYYIKLCRDHHHVDAIKASIFLFLMITGGYPAVTIILFYLLLTFYLINAVKLYSAKNLKGLWKLSFRNFQFLIYTVLFSLAMLLSVYQVSPYLSRLGEFGLELAQFSPFSPQSFISFLAPLTTTTAKFDWNSDLSMRNGYFGILVLLFFILGFFIKKPGELKVLFWFGLFALSAAVGEFLPVRELLFKYVPMMNVFRFPSVFRLYFLVGAILTGAYYLQLKIEDTEFKKKTLIYAGLSLILVFLTGIILAGSSVGLDLAAYVKNSLLVNDPVASLPQNLVIHSIVQIALLAAFIMVLWKVKDKLKLAFFTIGLVGLDMIISTQLVAPYTVYYDHVTSGQAAANVDRYPSGFPEQMNITIEEAGHLPGIGQPFWQNQNCFQKQISAEGFNSFSFSSYEELEKDYPLLFAKVKENHLLMLSDTLLSTEDMARFQADSLFRSDQLFFDPFDLEYLTQRTLECSPGDTAILRSYDANSFHIKTSTKHKTLLTLHQKMYKGWKATVNGKKARIFKSNLNFMTIVVPPGENEVKFEYSNTLVRSAFLISVFFLFTALITLIVSQWKKLKRQRG